MRRALGRLFRRPLVLAVLAAALAAAGWLAWRQYPRTFLRRGEEALQARAYDEARAQLERYLGYRPDDPHARLLAARAARNARAYHDAREHLRRGREAGGDAETFEIETALLAVARGAEPTPELRRRAEADDELALAVLEVLIQHDLDTYRLRPALHELTRYLNARPDDLQALLARAFVWERFLSFVDALHDYRRAAAAHPDSAPARLKLGQTLLIAGTPSEALEQFEWLAERRPDQSEVRLGLARCRRLLGDDEAARRLLDALLERAPNDGEALWERGQIEFDRGRTAEALPWLRWAAAARPHDRRIVFSLARCLRKLGRDDEASKADARVAALDADLRRLEKVRQAVMERPFDAELRREMGVLFLRHGERDEGLRCLRYALRLDPGNRAARAALEAAEAAGAPP